MLSSSGTSFLLAEAAIVWESFSLQAEYLRAVVHDSSIPNSGVSLGDLDFDGVHVYTSYFLTGESRPYQRESGTFGRILPSENVRTGNGNMLLQGAWEIALRYSHVNLNDQALSGGILDTMTAGLTWYLNPNTKAMFNYILANRDVTGTLGDGDASLFGMRFHISF